MEKGPETFYQCISDFIFVKDTPRKADVIFIPGGHVGDHARTAARLYREGYAKWVLPSGKYSKEIGRYIGPEEETFETEWDYLHSLLRGEGVPEEAILREREATFTWENAICSRKVLEKAHIPVRRAILCPQAHHARRALMYYQEQFPDTELIVVPTVTGDIRPDNWFLDQEKTNVVLGEVERIGRQFHCVLPLRHMPSAGRIR